MDAAHSSASSGRDEDDRLIRRVADGDAAAWPMIVDRHLASVVGCAWYLLGDHAEAEDVAQETFVRLMTKAGDWRPGGALLRTWLHRVATNMCIDRLRRNRPASLDGLTEAGIVVGTVPGPGDAVDRRLVVRKALDALPETQRLAVVLVHYQGFTNREAAEALDSSVEAVESLLARARRTLRTRLGPALPDLLGVSA